MSMLPPGTVIHLPDDVIHVGPNDNLWLTDIPIQPQPRRDDHFSEYLRRARDAVMNDPAAGVGRDPGVFAGEVLDDLLDDYRLRADLGLGLLDDITDADR